MKSIRDILLALICTAVIVGVTMNDFPLALENPAEMISRQTKNIQGIPEEIQGVWVDPSSGQDLTLRGNQMIQSNEVEGIVYYTVHSTQVTDQFALSAVEDNASRQLYTLSIDLADYQMRYGEEEAANLADETTYLIYDSSSETVMTQDGNELSRDRQAEIAYIIQDDLVASQPIHREQLQAVDPDFLLRSYESQQAAGSLPLLENVYWDIAREYPDLGLLTESDYQAYQELSQAIIKHSDLTYNRMNQAGPKQVLELYQNAQAESSNGASMDELVKSIYPDIEAAIQAYHDRQLTRENSLKFSVARLEKSE